MSTGRRAVRWCLSLVVMLVLTSMLPAPLLAHCVKEWPLPAGLGVFGKPAVGPDGAIWFLVGAPVGSPTPSGIGRISDDEKMSTFPLPQPTRALGLAFDGSGALWYTDATRSAIVKYIPGGGSEVFLLPTEAAQPNQIVLGPDGNLWFTEISGARIGRITPSGVVTEFPVPGTKNVYGIVVGPEGDLSFTYNSGIGQITTSGEMTLTTVPGSPWALTVGPTNDLWYTQGTAPTIGRFSKAGSVIEFPIPGGERLWDLTAPADGRIWFTDLFQDVIGALRADGTLNILPREFPFAGNLATGPGGNVWYSAEGVIGRINVPPLGTSPSIEALHPPFGPSTGGTDVEILGSGFADGITVTFGEIPANSVVVNDFDSLSVVTPAHPVGVVDVTVTSCTGESTILESGFTFDCQAPLIQVQPHNQEITVGEEVTLQVEAIGTSELLYQWYLGAAGSFDDPIPGATSPSLVVKPSTTTSYWVQVTNQCGITGSQTAKVTVCEPPTVTAQPASKAVLKGARARLKVEVTGTEPLHFQWYEGQSGDATRPVDGATGSSFLTRQLFAETAFWVRVMNGCGATQSSTARIQILERSRKRVVKRP